MTHVIHRSSLQMVDADVDHMAEYYAKTLKPAKVMQLDRSGRISVEDQHYSIGNFDIWCGKCSSGMRVTFSEPAEAYVLYLPISGAMEIDIGRKRLTSVPGVGLVGDLSAFDQLTLHKERSHLGIAFDKSMLVSQLSELLDGPVLNRLDFSTSIGMGSAASAHLFAMGSLLWGYLGAEEGKDISSRAIEYFFRSIMVMLLETVPHNYSARLARPTSPAIPRNMKRAIDYMNANVARPVTVSDIAREAGTSVRALQLAFRQFKGTSPLNHLRQLRLQGVHRALTEDVQGMSIAQIAQQWGFTHMGRFSELYYKAYGRTPSEIVNNASKRRR